MAFEPCLIPEHPLWEVYHESSKWMPSDWAEVGRRAASARPPGSTSARGRRGPFVPLPDPPCGLYLAAPLEAALKARRSSREFDGSPLSWEEVATLLWASGGPLAPVAGAVHLRRTVPSAGACYPIDVYFWLPVPPDAEHPGPYYYDPVRGGATLVAAGPADSSVPALVATAAYQPLVERAGLLIALAAVFVRTTARYGARGYRFAVLEAGHAAQNVYLAAAAMGLGAVALGGWDDAALDALAGLDGTRASVLYLVSVGREPRRALGGG